MATATITDSQDSQLQEQPGASSQSDVTSHTLKFVLLGNGSAGKTSLARRYCGDSFAKEYMQTPGVDYFRSTIQLDSGADVTSLIHDIGGQQIGSMMIPNYIHDADAILFVYDITNTQSFDDLEDWVSLVDEELKEDPSMKRPLLAIIGNKVDLVHIRKVSGEQHNKLISNHKATGFFVSARTGDKVNTVFKKIISDVTGIPLSRMEADHSNDVLKAEIVTHQKDKGVFDGYSKVQKHGIEKHKSINGKHRENSWDNKNSQRVAAQPAPGLVNASWGTGGVGNTSSGHGPVSVVKRPKQVRSRACVIL